MMYDLRCLGEATLRDPREQLIHFRSRKHFALLVYLALNADRAHRRERLAGLLWSDSDDSRARHSLSQALYAVRRLLEGAVHIEGEDLELKADQLRVDALELERNLASGSPDAAADLYRGEFLEGFWIRGAHGFEEWASRERARMAALARDALRSSIKRARDGCDWLEVRRRSERLIQLDPYDEVAYAELMRALWMVGDRAAALDRYDELKRVLAKELRTKPSRDTDALVARVRARSVRGGWNGTRVLRESETSVFEDPPFVGRKRELAALAEGWECVERGESRTVALVGPAGIGKTRLAEEFIKSLALSDLTVLKGRCYEAEQALPYGPVAEALRQGLEQLHLADSNPLWLAELARIVPEAHELYGDLPDPPQLDAEGGRRRLYEGIAQVMRAACDARPTLLFVDDLHWADDSSLSLLHYLQRRASNGLYLIVAYRPEEISEVSSGRTVEALSYGSAEARTLQLESLDGIERSSLSKALLGDNWKPKLIESLDKLGEGNPFFTIELARNLIQQDPESAKSLEVPDSIRGLFDRRFCSLTDRAIALVQQTALLGSRIAYGVLKEASGLSPFEFDATLRELIRQAILSHAGDSVSFRHDLVRELAVRQIPSSLKATLHLRAARALMRLNGDAGEIAQHLAAAGDTRRAFRYALRGADIAEAAYALEQAVDLLELAMEHVPNEEERIDLHGRLGALFYQMRQYEKARPLFSERLEHYRQRSDQSLARFEAERDLLFVDVYSSLISPQRSAEKLAGLYEQLGQAEANTTKLEAEILSALFWAAARSFNPTLVNDTIQRVETLHKETQEPRILWRTSRVLGIYESYKGNLRIAEKLLEGALDWAEKSQNQGAVLHCYVGLATLLLRSVRADLAERILRDGVPVAELQADPGSLAALLSNCAFCHMYLRNADRATEILVRAEDIARSRGQIPDTPTAVVYNLGFVARLNGNLTRARSLIEEALAGAERDGLVSMRQECLAALGNLEFEAGNISAARLLAAKSLRLARRGGFLVDQRAGLEELLAKIRHCSGKTDKALKALGDVVAAAMDRDVPLLFTALVTTLQILLAEGRKQEAQKVLQQVRQAAVRYNAPAWRDYAEMIATREPAAQRRSP